MTTVWRDYPRRSGHCDPAGKENFEALCHKQTGGGGWEQYLSSVSGGEGTYRPLTALTALEHENCVNRFDSDIDEALAPLNALEVSIEFSMN